VCTYLFGLKTLSFIQIIIVYTRSGLLTPNGLRLGDVADF
jgi:hypothetical protein